MTNNVIGKIPEFTSDSSAEELEKVSDQSEETVDTSTVEETDTPSQPPADEQPASQEAGEDTEALKEKLREELRQELRSEAEKEIQGLRDYKKDLIQEISELRGEKRKAKEAELQNVQDKIDDLKDLHPQDVEIVERILRSKGYVAKHDMDRMLYESRKQEEVAKFLGEFREYSEDNDPDRKRFDSLLKEVALYKEPDDPKMLGTLLRRAHKTLNESQGQSDRVVAVKRQQIKVASAGSATSQRSSSTKPLDDRTRQLLRDGGWSEEEINQIQKNRS